MNVATALAADVEFTRTRFLVVDSKPLFRDMAHTALANLRAAEIKHAMDVNEAVTILKQSGRQIGGIVCDWELAPIGGLELLRMIRSRTIGKVNPEICAVLLTGRADAAAMRAAMLLDVNGVAIAPLSMEKLVRTFTQAVSRPWKLQSKEHYLKVPVVEVPAADASNNSVSGKEIWRRDVGAQDGVRPQTTESPAPKPPMSYQTNPNELHNVRMCTLAEVRSGVVLARDLKDNAGTLLLKSGTDLSTALLERLRDVAHGHADSYHVWIGERRA